MLHRAGRPRLTRGGWFLSSHGERGDTHYVEAGGRSAVRPLAAPLEELLVEPGVEGLEIQAGRLHRQLLVVGATL